MMSPFTLVVWNKKPETGDVEGGLLTPSTVNRMEEPAGMSLLSLPSKNTCSRSSVSP